MEASQIANLRAENQIWKIHLSTSPCLSFFTCEMGTRLLRLPLPMCPYTAGSSVTWKVQMQTQMSHPYAAVSKILL